MNNASNASKNDILLDAGTNELEVLVFRLAGGLFGVNVAKVREVIRFATPSESPMRHASVMGMINLRSQVVPLIDLKKHLDLGEVDPADPANRVIIMEFNGLRSGYVVDGVDQIYRLAWTAVREAPDVHSIDTSDRAGPEISACTGVIDLDGKLVLMLDFESVADAILLEDKLHVEQVDNPHGVDRASQRVILAEDSPFMRDLMTKVLRNSGYTGLEVFSNGADAWNTIQNTAEDRPINAIISDIEMPQMDGLHLCTQIRASKSPAVASLPVVLFSSLISEDNAKKGQQVGASVQVPKPDLAEMVLLVDRACTGQLDHADDAIRHAA
ncbi:MAG: chemotaxis protein [Planctomycetota bacterium]